MHSELELPVVRLGNLLHCVTCSEYMVCVKEALELEDTIRNYERRSSTGWFAPIHFSIF